MRLETKKIRLGTLKVDLKENSQIGNSELRFETKIVDWKHIRQSINYKHCFRGFGLVIKHPAGVPYYKNRKFVKDAHHVHPYARKP